MTETIERTEHGEIAFKVGDISDFMHLPFYRKYNLLLDTLINGALEEFERASTFDEVMFIKGKVFALRSVKTLPEQILESIGE